MSDYKENTLAGRSWQRCCAIGISNIRGCAPTIRFVEEEVVQLGSEVISRQVPRELVVPFDPATVITLLDPATGLPTGKSITHGALYVALYSAYMGAAMAHDQATEAAKADRTAEEAAGQP